MAKRTRKELCNLFKQGAMPSGADFADLIESMLNAEEDGILKPVSSDEPLKITAHGTDENILDLCNRDKSPSWRINQKSMDKKKSGLNLTSLDTSKVFVENSTGNVGVNTDSPDAKIHIKQTGNKPAIRVDDKEGDMDPFIIDSEGKVGIGTIAPQAKLSVNGGLHVGGDSNPGNKNLLVEGNGTIKNQLTTNALKVTGDSVCKGQIFFHAYEGEGKNGTAYIHTGDTAKKNNNINLQFRTLNKGSHIQAMRITGNGKVGIGTTVPKARLDINGTVCINNGDYYAVIKHMSPGSLTIGGRNQSFGGRSGWNANVAGLLMETKKNTEIAVHEHNTRLASLMHYEGGSKNQITVGRDMGWGTIKTIAMNGALTLNGSLSFKNNEKARISGELRGADKNVNTVVLGGYWDELEVKGRVIDWTGSNLHIGFQNDHSNHNINIGHGKLKAVNIEGKTDLNVGGNTIIGGKVGIGTGDPKVRLDINGAVCITKGDTIGNKSGLLVPGSLCIGHYGTNYGGKSGWAKNVAGLLMEAKDITEIAVNDHEKGLFSLMYYEGGNKSQITIGRNMGFGSIGTINMQGNLTIPRGKTVTGIPIVDLQGKNWNFGYHTGSAKERTLEFTFPHPIADAQAVLGGWRLYYKSREVVQNIGILIKKKKISNNKVTVTLQCYLKDTSGNFDDSYAGEGSIVVIAKMNKTL